MTSNPTPLHIVRAGDVVAQPLGTAGMQWVLLGGHHGDGSPLVMGVTQVKPGQTTQLIRHDTAEIGYILAGTGWMVTDTDAQPVHPGDAVLIAAGRWHAIRAGDRALQMLYVFPDSHVPATVAYESLRYDSAT